MTTNRPSTVLLVGIALLVALHLPTVGAVAGELQDHDGDSSQAWQGPMPLQRGAGEGSPSDDYMQVVEITFPFSEDTPVRYTDDYDACRSGCLRHHQSTDLMVALGTPVYAAMGGYVSWRSGTQQGPPSYGWMVRIAGDDGRDYAYVHLGEQDGPMSEAYAPAAEVGSRVEAGQLIGWAGCSGSAVCGGGEHLHFEIHDANVVDPYDYHDHERINPHPSLVAAEARGDYPVDPDAPVRVFDDVDPSSTHGRSIELLAESGITRGCGADRFCPDGVVTRQQMASFLVRALGLEEPAEADFDDVGEDNVHRADIARLARSGITQGCAPASFCPDQSVSRAQMASFLTRALDLDRPTEVDFRDVGRANAHRRNIAAIAAAGITVGCGEGVYCPDQPVTRAQMATFLVRALDLGAEDEDAAAS